MVTPKQFDICTQEKNVYSGKQTDEPLTAQTDTDSQTDKHIHTDENNTRPKTKFLGQVEISLNSLLIGQF